MKLELNAASRLRNPVKAAKEEPTEWKVSDLVTDSEYTELKAIAKMVASWDGSSSWNGASDDILKNRKYTAKALKNDIDILVSAVQTMSKTHMDMLRKMKTSVGK